MPMPFSRHALRCTVFALASVAGLQTAQAQQFGGPGIHAVHVKLVVEPERLCTGQGVPMCLGVGDPVAVASPQGGEPGIKAFVGTLDRHDLHGTVQIPQDSSQRPIDPALQGK